MRKNVAIVHYNTPELTEAAILSVKKHGGMGYNYFILDNSDKRPFTAKMDNVTVFDNTKGQYLDFDKELEKYPDKDEKIGCSYGCIYGSDKHMMSVQLLWDLVPDGFLLMDSDILLQQNVDFMFMPEECAAGHIMGSGGPRNIQRLAPMLLWINVPMCKAGGAVFFDPSRSWALHKGMLNKRNFWDTGAALLDDIKRLKPQCHGKRVDVRPLFVHYGHASWKNNDLAGQQEWLNENKSLWYTDPNAKQLPKYTVLTYIFNGYEVVHEIREKDPEAEYILVTDNPDLKSNTWTVVYDGSLSEKSAFDKCYHVRFHPFLYANTNIVVRVDGSIGINKPLKPIIDTFNASGYDRCWMIHPKRNSLPEEYDIWVQYRKYPRAQADKCLRFMERMGYDLETKGLYQGCFEIVRKNRVNDELNDLVFDFLRYLGTDGKIERLDQTITSFVANHLFSDRLNVMPVSESLITNNEMMEWYIHKSNRRIPDDKDKIEPVLFGKPVKEVCYED